MNIIRTETTLIPNSCKGKEIADELERKFKEQNCFRGRKEDTQYISIKAEYHFSVKDGEAE